MDERKQKNFTPRATKTQAVALRETIKGCLDKMMSRGQILQYVRMQPMIDPATTRRINILPIEEKGEFLRNVKKWDLTDRAIDKHIEIAREEREEELLPTRKKLRTQLYYPLRNIVTHCIGTEDYRTAITAMERMCKMYGLDAPQQLEIEAEVTPKPAIDFSKLSTKELKTLKAIMEKGRPKIKEGK